MSDSTIPAGSLEVGDRVTFDAATGTISVVRRPSVFGATLADVADLIDAVRALMAGIRVHLGGAPEAGPVAAAYVRGRDALAALGIHAEETP